MARKHPTKKWPFKFVEVVWRDIVTGNKWTSVEDFRKPSIIHERGWLVHEDDKEDFIVISAQLAENDEEDKLEGRPYDMGIHTSIPCGCVISVKEVK
jgi:hypothetical protein